MAKRRYRPRRQSANYVWQNMTFGQVLDIPQSGSAQTVNFLLAEKTPGVGFDLGGKSITPFTSDHTLERVVGAMAHNGEGGQTSTTTTDWFAFVLAAVKIPSGLSMGTEGIDLFDSSEADDFLFRMDAVCNETNAQAMPNWHEVNAKARRKFDVGDAIQFLASVHMNTAASRAVKVDLSVNLRFLWRLKV